MTATADILAAPASHAEIRELARLAVDFARRSNVPESEDDALLALLLLAYQMGKRSRDRLERAS